MQPKEKVGNIIVPSNNIDQLIDMVKRHYKKTKNEKKGMREIREIQQIFKGTRNDNPEFLAKKQRRIVRDSHSKFSSLGDTTTKQGSVYSRSLR